MAHTPALDLNLLPAVEALLTEQNVTRAGDKLGLSQSAMSHALSRARETFQDELLVRSGRGLLRTPRADALLLELRPLLAQAKALVQPSGAFNPRTETRTFKVATTDHAQMQLLPALLPALLKAAPHAKLELRPIPDAMETELENELDLIISAETRTSPRLRRRLLGKIPLVCLHRAGAHSLPHPLSAAALRALPQVQVVPTSRLQAYSDDVLSQEAAGGNVRLRVSHFIVAASIVARSELVCIADAATAGVLTETFPLEATPLASGRRVCVVMYWHERLDRDPAHQWLRQLLHDAGRPPG